MNHRKGKRVPENVCFCFIDYTEAFDCVSSVQSLSHVRLFVMPWTAARQASLFIINYWSLPKAMSIESVMPSNHLILCHPLLLLLSIFPSIRVFSNESALRISWPNYWSYSFSISPSNEHPGLISFRMDWLDLLAERDLTVWITTKCGKFLRSWEYQTTRLAFWEICMHVKKQVRTRHGTTNWFQIGNAACQGCIFSSCLLNLYAECIMWNARLDKHKPESRLPGEISITSDLQVTPP